MAKDALGHGSNAWGASGAQSPQQVGRQPITAHAGVHTVGTRPARGGGRFRLGGVAAAGLGILAGLASAVVKPAMGGGGGGGMGRRRR